MIKLLTTVFVYLHIAAIISWSLPEAPARLKIGYREFSLQDKVKHWSAILLYWNQHYLKTGFLADYLTLVGARQNWNMFAPNPVTHDLWVDAEVELADGTLITEVFPRPSQEALVKSFVKERYRKFIESASEESYAVLWPQLALYLARKSFAKHTRNPPVRIALRRHVKIVMSPGHEQPEGFDSFVFFETPVTGADLS